MKRPKDPFVSNRDTGLYFWRTGGSNGAPDIQHSNRPHELLPHYCQDHDWYTDQPCPAWHGPPPSKGLSYDDAADGYVEDEP